jgi:uroporphyrinogen-III decarboxylase
MIKNIDFNAYCAGHLSGSLTDSRIIPLPEGFFTEAEALGAAVRRTQGGFETVQYLIENPEALYKLPNIADSEGARRVLEQVSRARRTEPADKTIMLKANGPYSILASLIDPAYLYRWLIKYPAAIHHGLDRITGGLTDYLFAAVTHGASIISLADPYANIDILGEKYYREFAAPYLMALLQNMDSKINAQTEKPNIIIHLCPHNSIPLVQLGYMSMRDIAVCHDTYTGALISPPNFEPGLSILGNQCVYAQNINKLSIHRTISSEQLAVNSEQ